MNNLVEELRETQLELARAHAREEALRRETEAMMAGLRVIATAHSTAGLFEQLLEVLRGLIGFTEALVFLPGHVPPVVASSRPELSELRLGLGPLLERAAGRGPLAYFDRSRVPELAEATHLGTSVLLAPLQVGAELGCVLMMHEARGYFEREHVAIMRRLSPMLGQAVLGSRHREQRGHAERESLARFPEENPRPIFRADSVGALLYANPAGSKLLAGLGRADELPEAWVPWFRSTLEGETGFQTEVDAGDRSWSVVIAPVPAEGYANAYFADITDRRQAEADLLRSNGRISALVSQQHTAVLLEDEHRRVVLANQAMCDLFGIPVPPEVLVGSDCAEAAQETKVLFSDPVAFLEGVAEALAEGCARIGEELHLADGRVVERDYIPIQVAGEPGGHLWQYREVTERHLVKERLLQAKREAERANEAKSDFLARMSHEIRTPLNAMMGMTELVLDSELSEEQRSWLRGAHSNSRALLFLINDILDLSRIESGTVRVAAKSLELEGLVEEVVEGFSARAVARGLELCCRIDSAVPAAVLGDADRIRQVLANLLGNAIKYTDRGEVGVSLKVEDETGRVSLTVWDTGTGIAASELDRIFERYAQAETGARPGTGLGLYITRQLVAVMGGELTVESEVGRGSRFRVALPMEVLRGPRPLGVALRGALVGLRVMVAMAPGKAADRLHESLAGAGLLLLPWEEGVEVEDVDVVLLDDRVSPAEALRLRAKAPLVHLAPVMGSLLSECLSGSGCPRVVKPLRRRELLGALARGAGRLAADTVADESRPGRARRLLRVLVVDDNADNRMVARGYLEAAGHHVLAASGGAEGVALALSEHVDVVLMDLHMPEVDGLEATRRLRAEEAQGGRKRLPILAFTAHATPRIREQANAAGMDDFLAKPVQRRQLLEALERAVGATPCVLIVDDAPDMRRLVGHFLRKADLQVVEAVDGVHAEAAIAEHGPDIVLMDVEMPGRSGPDTVEVLRAAGCTLPIVALTGHTDPETHAALEAAGYDAVLTKPVRRAALVETVRNHLRGD